MYGNKLAAAIKVGNKVLREFKDTVYIPFGSEYAVTLKNLHTTRVVVNVYIDGDNIVPGGLVLNAGQSVDLERAIRNGNLTEGNRFKFIERTSNIEQHRGIGIEDGLVRVEYQFEIPRPIISISDNIWKSTPISGSTGDYYDYNQAKTYNVNGTLRSADFSKGEQVKTMAAKAISNYCADNNIVAQSEYHEGTATMDWNDAGITVPGSKSTQSFQTTTLGALEADKHNLIFKLVGDLGHNKPVEQAVTVKHKPRCRTCGHTNKATAQYCNKCGTALVIYA